ncbi:hypothetical protein EVAR_72304_1 [Eumeta japonica]|uniref:Uncharacterized protein n=1 Tax=Eumeta variegata TaxID=151549 RepID=A0A4C2AFQ0_EUMVA|nr:hypothetical protein EVAR_72304_1 [Eumeta japonica]
MLVHLSAAKERDDKLKVARERQNEERQRKIEELKAQAEELHKDIMRTKEEERRRRIDEIRQRDSEKRTQVEERRESRIEVKNVKETPLLCFWFLDATLIGALRFWHGITQYILGSKTFDFNIKCCWCFTLTSGSERELNDSGSKKRATSSGWKA